MSSLIYLLPLALLFGAGAFAAFLWSLRSGQYDDMQGAAVRILLDDENEPHETKRGAADSPSGD